jgi:putative ABC transport system permease protein
MSPQIAFQEIGGPLETTIFAPLVPSDWDLKKDLGGFNYKVIARLKPGVTLDQARAELEALQQAYSISARLPVRLGISLIPLADDVTSGISGALWLMFSAVGGVLLIACVNLANLQLARSVSSERETAVRAALGASKGQLVMARLAESLVVALAGGAAGVVLALSGVRLLIALAPGNVPRLNEVQVNLPVLLFAAGVSIASALLFGVALASRPPPGGVAG